MTEIGNLSETRGEVTIQWKIEEFSLLSVEEKKRYDSPTFYFSGTSWCIRLYPNGNSEENDGWLSLFLVRKSYGSFVTVKYSCSLKSVDKENALEFSYTTAFDETDTGYGEPKFLQRSDLVKRNSELLPSDTLTIVCTLRNSEPRSTIGSLFSRLHEVSDNLIDIYRKAKKTDVQFKVEDQIIGAHRLILEARSPVFSAMLNHDTRENQTGEVSIVDMDKSTLETILVYMYSGVIENTTKDTALQIYAAAEKYDLKAIKEVASKTIIDSLSVESVCDVIKFSELFQDKKISHLAREYFKENADKVLETDTWEKFMKENHNISVELLATVVKTLFKK